MKTISITRIKQISLDMTDCLADMKENIELYNTSEEKYKRFLQQSFRASLVQYKELLGNYISHCLKEVNISVTELTYFNAIQIAVEKGYLPQESEEFFKTLSRYRNQASHTYKKPPFEVIRRFYIENEVIFNDILLHINKFINNKRNS